MKPINVVLAVALVAVLLGCGGDPADPPKGSLEDKMKGCWEAEPIPPAEGEKGIRHVTRTISISYWKANRPNGMHTWADYSLKPVAKVTPSTEPNETRIKMGEFTYEGLTASGEALDDGSWWTLQLDADDPNTLYVTWTLKDGTKKLEAVKFRRAK